MFRLSQAFVGTFMTRGESSSNVCPAIINGGKYPSPGVPPPPPRRETPSQSVPLSSPHIRAELGVPPGCCSATEPVSDSSNALDVNHGKAPMAVDCGIDTSIFNTPKLSSGSSSKTLGSLSTMPVISSDAESASPGVPPHPCHGMPAEPLTQSSPRFGGNEGVIVGSLSPAASVLNSSNEIDGSFQFSCQKSRSKRHECKMMPQKRTLEGDVDGSKEPSKRAANPPTLSIISSPDPIAVASLSLHASPIDAVQAMAHATELQLCPSYSGSSDSHLQRRIPAHEVNVLAEELHSPMEIVLAGIESSHKIAMEKINRTHNQVIESLRNKLLREVDDIKRSHNDELDRLKFQHGVMQTDSAHPEQGVDRNREKNLKEVGELKDELDWLRSQLSSVRAESEYRKRANDLNREKHLMEVEDLKKNHKDVLDRLLSQLAAMTGDSSRLKQDDDRNRDMHLREVDDLKRRHKAELDQLRSQLSAMQADSVHRKQVDDLNRANSILNQEMESLKDKHKKEVGDLRRIHKDALDRLRSRLAAMAGDSSRLKQGDDCNRNKHLREVDDLKRSHKAELDQLRSQLSAMQADSARHKQVDDLNRRHGKKTNSIILNHDMESLRDKLKKEAGDLKRNNKA